MEFKDRLKALRKEKGFSQKDLASLLHYHYTAISNYEAGRNQPKINDLIRLANIFGVSVDYLLGLSDVKHYMIQHSILQQNIAKKAQEKNIEFTLMDSLITYFLYSNLKASTNETNIDLKQISQLMQDIEQDCGTQFMNRFVFFIKNRDFRNIVLTQMQTELNKTS